MKLEINAVLGIGMLSCTVPAVVIVIAILSCTALASTYGVAIAAVGMLSTLGLSLATDAFGPGCPSDVPQLQCLEK